MGKEIAISILLGELYTLLDDIEIQKNKQIEIKKVTYNTLDILIAGGMNEAFNQLFVHPYRTIIPPQWEQIQGYSKDITTWNICFQKDKPKVAELEQQLSEEKKQLWNEVANCFKKYLQKTEQLVIEYANIFNIAAEYAINENQRLDQTLQHKLNSLWEEIKSAINIETKEHYSPQDRLNYPGIYFILSEQQLEYIGQSGNIEVRLYSHHIYSSEEHKVIGLKITNKEKRIEIERLLIKQLTPARNITYNRSIK